MDDIRDLTIEELREAFRAMGEPAYRAGQAFAWLYRKGATRFDQFTDFPRDLRVRLEERFSFGAVAPEEALESPDGTRKTLFRLADGEFVETVLIPSGERRTVCVSTQVGCKFACAFCASGLGGFKRDLRPGEIVGQLLSLRDEFDAAPTNVVFMGMGEPLDNCDNLVKAVRILNAPEGLGLAARRMTVSTSGIVPGIERLGTLGMQINLSISLHSADDEKRGRLMPVNRKYPLAEVLKACRNYLAAGGRMITFEYILIRGFNDTSGDADKLAGIAHRLKAKVNLIPFSPVRGLPFAAPDAGTCRSFLARLREAGVAATLRQSKGGDIRAACGQLAGKTGVRS
ncbi:MAG: 23S rRNA (adenine(2503)-C(2))-methyltransferase RlmN [Acidobacteriota bacterium]|nr:23S rRNA (adenine(2503)-C(2))-methyltransferase RlmN [Acidobacteriota bacterium]